MQTEKRCKACGRTLDENNVFLSSKERGERICKECKEKMFSKMRKGYKYSMLGDDYSISKSPKNNAPRISVAHKDFETTTNMAMKMLRDTEKFRFDRMVAILKRPDLDSAVKRQIIIYLLGSTSLLDVKTMAALANEINSMFCSHKVPESILAKMALDIKKYIDSFTAGKNKKEREKIFEEIREGADTIEVETPSWEKE